MRGPWPKPPHTIVENIPKALSLIIMQFLEKDILRRLRYGSQIVKQLIHIDTRQATTLTGDIVNNDSNISFANQKYIMKPVVWNSEDESYRDANEKRSSFANATVDSWT